MKALKEYLEKYSGAHVKDGMFQILGTREEEECGQRGPDEMLSEGLWTCH